MHASGKGASQIDILLWNVDLLPFKPRSAIRSPLISKFLLNYEPQPDILVLNEAFSRRESLFSAALLERYPYRHTLGKHWWRTIFSSGVWILSKHRIIDRWEVAYRRRSGWDRFAAKGIVGVRIEIAVGENIDVYGTHMQAGHEMRNGFSRLSQVQHIIDFINLHSAAAESKVILAGDLNMGPLVPGFAKSPHYVDEQDWKLRTEAFRKLINGLGLQPYTLVKSSTGRGSEDDINWILGRNFNNSEGHVEYIDVERGTHGDHDFELSDSDCLICHVAC